MRTLILGALFLPLALADVRAQQPGDLDTTFSGDGKLTIPGYDAPAAVVVQPDGKTLVATSTTDSTGKVFAILRLNYDGSMDPTFGVNGVALTDVGPGHDEPRDMVLQADGKFIVTNKHGWCLVRFLPNGQVDNNWAVNGVMRIEFPGWFLQTTSMALQSDGKPVISGYMDSLTNSPWAVALRLNIHGAPDSTFSNNGVFLFPPGFVIHRFLDVEALPDGDIFLTDQKLFPTPPGVDVVLRRLTPSGIQSATYGTGYYSYRPLKQTLARQAGLPYTMFDYNCGGGPSDTYAHVTNNIAACLYFSEWPPVSGVSSARAFCTDQVDRFWYAGTKGGVWRVARSPAGQVGPDFNGFGIYGHVQTVFGIGDNATPLSITPTPDGKMTVAGVAQIGGMPSLALARYHNIPDPRARLSANVFLSGPYNALDQRMNDGLRTSGLLPQQQPYAALGDSAVANPDALFAWPGTMDTTGDSAVVDWVWLELLSAADSTTVLGSRAALVLRNGAVVGRDGRSAVDMNCGAGAYFLRISHRNHLSVTCSDPVQLSDSLTSVDFTSPATSTFGTAAQKEVNGVRMLWPGDVTHDGAVRYAGAGNDRDPILQALGGLPVLGTVAGYRTEDVNMDGLVKYAGANNDRDVILETIGGGNVLGVRYEQLP